MKTVLLLADQILQRLEFLHTNHFLHRDIKPDNFLMGLAAKKSAHIVHIIDFGLSKRYREPKTGEHIPYKDNKELTGTARYASVNTHLGVEQSRRDDCESVGYILLYFLKGSLPWQGLQGRTKEEKYNRIKDKKVQTTIEELVRGSPEEQTFGEYLYYCRNLRFDEKPDYQYLRRLFREAMQRNGFEYDYQYDWTSTTGASYTQQSAKKQASGVMMEPTPKIGSHQRGQSMQNDISNSLVKQRPPANKGFSHQTSNMQYGSSYMKPNPLIGSQGGQLN